MQRLHRGSRLLGITHVDIVVTIVTHEHQGVLPVTSIGILHITDGLVDHHLSVGLRRHGETADSHVAHIEFLTPVTGTKVGALAIIEVGVEAVIDITVDSVERVLALVSQQEVVRIETPTVGGQHAVIPHTATEEQEIFGLVGLGLCPVIEHLHITPVGIGIGGAT